MKYCSLITVVCFALINPEVASSQDFFWDTHVESQNYTSERSFMGVSLMKLVVFIGHLDEKVIWRAVILRRGTWQVISSVRIDFHVGVED